MTNTQSSKTLQNKAFFRERKGAFFNTAVSQKSVDGLLHETQKIVSDANDLYETQKTKHKNFTEDFIMAFFQSAVGVLQTLVVALGAGLGIWGGINLMEGYGNDNPGAKSQGMKQLMAGGGVALIGITLVPLLSGLF